VSVVDSSVREFTAICVCPRCMAALESGPSGVECTECRASYPLRAGVLHLLPDYDDDERIRFLANYDEIARADLNNPFEHDRETRHDILLDFIGDVRGKRVLDVGSSTGGYLLKMDALQRVALDLAEPFLAAIPESSGILRIRADAETLPFAPGSFDVIIISDVLEHLLQPERLAERLSLIASPETRVIVHVPWEENIDRYHTSEYEFTHLRSFTRYTFALLWSSFQIVRERPTHPGLEEPYIFTLRRFLPLSLYNVVVWRYFHRATGLKEYERRARWIRELPARERWLLRLYRPLFMMFELRRLELMPRSLGSGYAAPVPRGVGWLRRIMWRTRVLIQRDARK
jgi:SAM-dependent methyltransferase